MKIVFLCSLVLFYVHAYAMEVENIAKKIKEIEVSSSTYDKIDYEMYDPFVIAKPLMKKSNIKEQEATLPFEVEVQTTLQAILNERAFINNHWYSVGDKVVGYRVKFIDKYFVTLEKNSMDKTITLEDSKMIIKTKEQN